MKKIKNIIIINTLIFGLFPFSKSTSEAKIYKKVHNDGTIEYYNVKRKSQYNSRKSNFNTSRKSNFKKTIFPDKYDYLINEFCAIEGLDPYLIKCIIKVESNFTADAVSVAGAMGLMQLMQATARYYNVHDPLDPEENLQAGIKHFKTLMNYFKNDIPLSLAAYHAGLGRVKKKMAIPPIKSTINYVNRIMGYYNGTNGKNENSSSDHKIKKLYKRIDKYGDIIIYSK